VTTSTPNKGTYIQVWRALANNTQAEIVVNCPVSHMETLIQAVKKIKSTENAARKRMDSDELPHWGRLVVQKDLKAKTVTFSLTYALGDIV
jgi:hypothetical protein